MLLFTRGFAAASWGWRHRMRFVDHESDEYLRELVHYVQQHSGLGVFVF
jgi:predicted N-acyltransferase